MQRAADVLDGFRSLPLAGPDWLSSRQPILVLAPHADDETLGCGGMIAAAGAMSIDVRVAVLTDGSASHPGSRAFPPARLATIREAEAAAAVAELGLDPGWVTFLRLPDAQVTPQDPRFAAAVETLIDMVAEHEIGTICAPWRHDPHRDHELAHFAAAAAVARTGARHLSYPVWGWALPPDHPLPDGMLAGRRIDISRFLSAKRRAIQAHASQLGEVVHDDPAGFVLPQGFLAYFDEPWEVFLEN